MDEKTKANLSHYDFVADKEAWRALCAADESVPVYFKDWFWDANCGDSDDWQVILVKDNGAVVAAFPFVYARRKGLYHIENAWQIPAAGMWLRDVSAGNAGKMLKQLDDIVAAYVRALPYFDRFDVCFGKSLWTWQPFYWRGFDCIPGYTMIIDSADNFKTALSKTRRKLVAKTEKLCRVEVNALTKEDYWQFFLETYKVREREPHYTREQFFKLFDALETHSAMELRSVYEIEGGDLAAVNLCITDCTRLYDHFGAHMPGRAYGAKSLAINCAIKSALCQGKVFDFEGSMIQGVCEFNSSFNPRWETRYRIKKYSRRYAFADSIRHCARAIRGH